jgi:hypothetical protein
MPSGTLMEPKWNFPRDKNGTLNLINKRIV